MPIADRIAHLSFEARSASDSVVPVPQLLCLPSPLRLVKKARSLSVNFESAYAVYEGRPQLGPEVEEVDRAGGLVVARSVFAPPSTTRPGQQRAGRRPPPPADADASAAHFESTRVLATRTSRLRAANEMAWNVSS